MDEAVERHEGRSENCLGSGRGGMWGDLHPQQEGFPGTPLFHFTQVTEKLITTLRASGHSPYCWRTAGALLGLTVPPQAGWPQRRYGSSCPEMLQIFAIYQFLEWLPLHVAQQH